MAKNENAYVKGLRFVRHFRLLNGEFPMQQADMLLTIAQNPGITMNELATKLELQQSSISRGISALSKYRELGKPGLDLIVGEPDPRDSRRRMFYLTDSGKRVITKMLRLFDEDFSIDTSTDARVRAEQLHEEARAEADQSKDGSRGRPRSTLGV